MDQKNATKVRKEAYVLSKQLLDKLNAHKEMTRQKKELSPVNDAIYHVELALELIVSGIINSDDTKLIKEYINTNS